MGNSRSRAKSGVQCVDDMGWDQKMEFENAKLPVAGATGPPRAKL